MMNAYCVHEATTSDSEGYRTFVRLSYDLKEFDRLGNTHNPLFDYSWTMVPRYTQFSLAQYVELPIELRELIDQCSVEAIATKAKSITDKTIYYNFLYELSLIDRKDVKEWLLEELSHTIDSDIVIARLCYTIVLQKKGDENAFCKLLMNALQKNSKQDVLFSDLLAEFKF